MLAHDSYSWAEARPAMEELRHRRIGKHDLQSNPGVALGKLLGNRWYQARHCDFRAADADLTRTRIREKFYPTQALAHLIEHVDAAIEQRSSVARELHALGATVQQPHTQALLQIRDRLRDDGM